MNYPDGMTKQDWQHIDGQEHFKACPMHEDYLHDCSKEATEYLRPEFSPPRWVFSVKASHYNYTHIRIDFCPWCGEELERPDCICDRLSEQLRDDAAERKGETDAKL